MRKWIFISLLLIATRAQAQQINMSALDKVGAKAKEKTEVTLDESMLKFASGFLSDKKQDEAAAKKITSNLKGVFVRVYEFDKAGAYAPADLDPIRSQLKGPNWVRIVNIQDNEDGDDVQVWIHREGEIATGLFMMAIEDDEMALINIVGPIKPEDIATLGGQFGIPKIDGIILPK